MSSIFSQIIAGKVPGHFVYSDDVCVAIMTIQPIRPGHVLVIPRAEIDHWDDLSDALTAHLMQVSKKIAKAIKASFPCKRVALIIAGLEVPHTHLHLVPVDSMADMSFENLSMADASDLAAYCAKIKEQCA